MCVLDGIRPVSSHSTATWALLLRLATDAAGQGSAEQGRAAQGRAGPGRAGQGRAGQGRAGQGSWPLSTWLEQQHWD